MRYFDTGVLLKLYLPEPNAPQAVSLVRSAGTAPPLTAFHRLEIASAFHQKQGRGEITVHELQGIQSDFNLDLASGFYQTVVPAWSAIFQRAEAIAQQYTSPTLCRSLDTLHVAIALELGATEFCTFDLRQATMAKLTGLTVLP